MNFSSVLFFLLENNGKSGGSGVATNTGFTLSIENVHFVHLVRH